MRPRDELPGTTIVSKFTLVTAHRPAVIQLLATRNDAEFRRRMPTLQILIAVAICPPASVLPANQEKRAESSRLNPGRTDAPESVPSRLMTSLWTSPSAPSWQTSTLFLLGLTIQTSRVPFLQIDWAISHFEPSRIGLQNDAEFRLP